MNLNNIRTYDSKVDKTFLDQLFKDQIKNRNKMEESRQIAFNRNDSIDISDTGKIKNYMHLLESSDSSDGSELEQYVEKYLELKDKIEKDGTNKVKNLELLDQAFKGTIEKAAKKSSKKVDRFFSTYNIKSLEKPTINKRKYIETYINIANQLKLNSQDHSEKEINNIINDSLKGNSVFKSYEDFDLVMEISDVTYRFHQQVNNTTSKIFSTNEKKIIQDNQQYNSLINFIDNYLTSSKDFNELLNKIDESSFSEDIKESMTKGVNTISKTQKNVEQHTHDYSENLQQYKYLDDRIAPLMKLVDLYEGILEKNIANNDVENKTKYLAKIVKVQKQITELESEKSQYDIKMANSKSALKITHNASKEYIADI